MGNLPHSCGKNNQYFMERYCFIDARPPGQLIIHPDCYFGYGVKIITNSHDIFHGGFGLMVGKTVRVDKGAWIGSFATLYSCHIGEGAIVSVGSVVASQYVFPYTVVEGNPAKEIAVFDFERKVWRKI